MPIENPPRRTSFAEIETVLHALSLYGAGGIAAFGWAVGCFLDTEPLHWLPLWFSGALLIYNADRLRRDPADPLNLPARTAASARLRTASGVTLTLAAVVLIGLPIWRCDWVTLALVLGGTLVSLVYSIPILGFRWKDVPFIKTLFAPAILTAAIFGLLLLGEITPETSPSFISHNRDPFRILDQCTCLVGWSFAFLLFNMLLCDLRDIAGDHQSGIRSMPVLLGEKRARHLLWALAVAGQILLARLIQRTNYNDLSFALLSFITGLYQAWLLHATRHPRSERFYEWAVEGLLYLPALAWSLGWVLS